MLERKGVDSKAKMTFSTQEMKLVFRSHFCFTVHSFPFAFAHDSFDRPYLVCTSSCGELHKFRCLQSKLVLDFFELVVVDKGVAEECVNIFKPVKACCSFWYGST